MAYFPIISGIFSGKYLAIKLFISGKVLYLIKVKILKNISNIATKKTVFDNLRKKKITITNKTKNITASKLPLPILINILAEYDIFSNKFLILLYIKLSLLYNILIIEEDVWVKNLSYHFLLVY